ncbi:DUF4259 domain-containing protein [Asticcacaulis sp.]|uniref:DUF4259 domain-containing protein n=1 Tax=Asticcacaulis sp. TaxID=1872648 RepID=UPI003F7B761F
MGAWGIGPFDDDTGMELVEDAPDWATIREKLTVVAMTSDYIEFEEAVHGWTAAALVASALGASFDDADDEIVNVVANMGVMPQDLSTLAIRSLKRLETGNSHLFELWQDSDEFQTWLKGLVALATYIETGRH